MLLQWMHQYAWLCFYENKLSSLRGMSGRQHTCGVGLWGTEGAQSDLSYSAALKPLKALRSLKAFKLEMSMPLPCAS